MNRALACALLLTVVSWPARAAEQGDGVLLQMISYSEAGRAEWRIGPAVLRKQPECNPAENAPPLGPQEAARHALATVKQELPKVREWTLRSIDLRPAPADYPNRWFYQVETHPAKDQDLPEIQAQEHLLTVIILMDGSVLPQNYFPAHAAK